MAEVKITITRRKTEEEINSELSSLCKMMRLMSERDVDATLAQVLREMMVRARDGPIGGSELSKSSGINRITIIHHLKRLEGAGFVRRTEGKYVMRVQSAEEMLMEFRKDMERSFSEMDELAREIDSQFQEMERLSSPYQEKRMIEAAQERKAKFRKL